MPCGDVQRSHRAVVWEILLGILYGVIGFYLLAQPGAGLASLTLALAAYLVFEGVLEFVLSFQLRPLPGSGWLLFDGIGTLVLAVIIRSASRRPQTSAARCGAMGGAVRGHRVGPLSGREGAVLTRGHTSSDHISLPSVGSRRTR